MNRTSVTIRAWSILAMISIGGFPAAHAGNMAYTYDGVGRVTQVVFADGACMSYTYDVAGNRTQNAVLPFIANTYALATSQNVAGTFDPRVNDPTCAPLTITAASTPAHGTAAVINGGAAITYTPSTNYYGSDAFTYTISNGSVSTSGPVNVTVNAVILPPIANPSSPTVSFASSNDSLPLNITGGAAASVAITAGPSHGTAAVNGVSSITYSPTTNYSGADTITYQATNISGSSSANLSITVSPPAALVVSIAAGSSASGTSSSHTFSANTASVSGGSGMYSYNWQGVGDANGTWNTGGTASSFTPMVTAAAQCAGTTVATYKVTVTDTTTHQTQTSNVANYSYRNTSTPRGGCP